MTKELVSRLIREEADAKKAHKREKVAKRKREGSDDSEDEGR